MRFSRHLIIILATVCYVGKIPVIPATALCALTAAIVIIFTLKPVIIAIVLLLSAIIGCLIAKSATQIYCDRDPRCFVLDELAGISLSLLFLPVTPCIVISAFFIFRFFDIIKPLGISKLDQMSNPVGIVLDDLLAGLYTNIILQISVRLF